VDTPVSRIEANADGTATAITVSGQRFRGAHVIVCAGKWTRSLIQPLGFDLPVTRVRTGSAWFDVAPKLFEPGVFPGFAVLSELGFHYGFPDLEGQGLKAGRHDGGQPIGRDDPIAPFGPADSQDIEAFLRRHLPGSGQLRFGLACEYDMTPDEDFIVGRVPGCPQVVVATGFSGHGFKFATALGEALADLVTEGASRSDLSRFACTRFLP
jgi:N-methyl-L-tryptophan oxidase